VIELNTEQQKTVTAKSPVMVNASAGSGKTRCLIARIISLLEQGVEPKNICAITFTNKAANEMKKRIKDHMGSPGNMQVSTIHSLCVSIIKNFTRYTALKNPFSIYDDGNQLSVIKTIIKSKDLPGEYKTYVLAISNIKSSGDSNIKKVFRKSKFSHEFAEKDFLYVYKTYNEILIKNNACDFDDLLTYANDCLSNFDCSNYYSKLWPHLLVDEFQDTSLIQYDIVNKLHTENSRTLFVVGDYNQSIYRWRNANPENMQDFIDRYNPTVCNLTFNYRSSPEVIKHANKYIQYGEPMIPKNKFKGQVSFTGFDSQEDEAEKISNAILRLGDFENIAILYRVNTRSLLFERAFAQKRIPYKVIGGLPYFKRKVSRDLICYLKSSINRSDIESLSRIVNTPPRKFGPNKKEMLLKEGWPYLKEIAKKMPLIQGFIKLLDEIKDMTPSDAVDQILLRTNYRNSLKKDTDRNMLSSFQDMIKGYEDIDELILASTFLEEDTGHGVKLLTAHASKGLEFDNVLIVGVEEGLWPHNFSQDIKEEKRLYYVACTRARKLLNISYSRSKMYGNTVINCSPSDLFMESYENHKK
jgi:DNA helicase-2/ATP-dependent DNA helicase PcrA